MKTLLKYWPLVLGLTSALAAVHLHLVEDAERDESIRVLKTIVVQEHAEYWPVLFPGVKP